MNPQHAHDLFLLMVQLSQMREVGRIWEVFVDGLNDIGLGVTVQRVDGQERSGTVLPVAASGQKFGALLLTPTGEPDAALPLVRNAAAMLAVILQGRLAAVELAALHAATRDELKDARLLNERILETTPDLITIYDLEERGNVYVNRAAEQVFGLPPKELQELGSELFAQLIHPEDLALVLANQERLVQGADGEVTEVEYRMRDAKGQWRWYHSREIPFARHPDGRVSRKLAIAVDVTDQRAIEDHLRQSQKMEAIGQLASGVAHDFNNVLCAITGNAELMLEELSPEDPLRESLVEIHQASERGAKLTHQLLAFSRRQLIAPKVLNLSQQIEQMGAMLSRLLGEDILLSTLPQLGSARIVADPNQLEQLVLNLAINARDAMPNGGELMIETIELRAGEEGFPPNFDAEHVVALLVTDTGCGMSSDVVEHVFEPFFTTKALGRGTGLGLATVFGIVEQSSAHIDVHSKLGEGSSFRVYFPAVTGDFAEKLSPVEVLQPQRGEETVLLVEDEESVRRVATRLLRRLGYKVLTASSGGDALVLAGRHEGAIDLLLTDVVMPHMNGRELAQRITETHPALKVLFTSGYTESVIAQHGLLEERLHFLPKPYSMLSLSERLRQVLGEGE
ncbi:MAG: hybrid sensor histidine kinase/response regulator [Deltaproteobacteria bacterium CG_4_9_14_3_um_filter_63_12]|nr:MAG: hybrid sensor histidine kinase/response regulator [Deltaproteobacteria bacterium CG_4_9_14_3_um_filter_63_12]